MHATKAFHRDIATCCKTTLRGVSNRIVHANPLVFIETGGVVDFAILHFLLADKLIIVHNGSNKKK